MDCGPPHQPRKGPWGTAGGFQHCPLCRREGTAGSQSRRGGAGGAARRGWPCPARCDQQQRGHTQAGAEGQSHHPAGTGDLWASRGLSPTGWVAPGGVGWQNSSKTLRQRGKATTPRATRTQSTLKHAGLNQDQSSPPCQHGGVSNPSLRKGREGSLWGEGAQLPARHRAEHRRGGSSNRTRRASPGDDGAPLSARQRRAEDRRLPAG